MTKTTYILIRESSNESGYTAHSFPTEMAAYTAMNCMIKSHTAAIETTYHIPLCGTGIELQDTAHLQCNQT